VVSADGVQGTLRAVKGPDDGPMPTDDAAYRAVITDPMLQDPEGRAAPVRPIALHLAVGSLRTWILVVQRAKKDTN
jgi:hypothetical protein